MPPVGGSARLGSARRSGCSLLHSYRLCCPAIGSQPAKLPAHWLGGAGKHGLHWLRRTCGAPVIGAAGPAGPLGDWSCVNILDFLSMEALEQRCSLSPVSEEQRLIGSLLLTVRTLTASQVRWYPPHPGPSILCSGVTAWPPGWSLWGRPARLLSRLRRGK